MLTTDQLSDLRKNAYQRLENEVAEMLETNIEKGLDKAEIKARQKEFGKNQLEEREQKSIFNIILAQLNNPVVYLLAAAALLAFIFGDIPEAIVIIVVLIANTIIGFGWSFRRKNRWKPLKNSIKPKAGFCVMGKKKKLMLKKLYPVIF